MPSAAIASRPRRRRERALSGAEDTRPGILEGAPRLDDPVAQEADAIDLQLHHVAALEEGAQLEAAAAADGPRADEVAWKESLGARDIGDDLLEAPVHVRGRAARPLRAVHVRGHRESVGVRNL